MNKNDLKDSLFEQLLIYAADSEMEHLADGYPSDKELEKQVSFSPAFDKRMERFFRKNQCRARWAYYRRPILKAGLASLVFLVLSTAVALNVDALRAPVFNMLMEWGDEATTIRVLGQPADYSAFSEQLPGLYLPQYIPAGYIVESVDHTGDFYRATYQHPNGSSMHFEILLPGSTMDIDNEDAQVEEVTVRGEPGQLFMKNGYDTLVFQYDGHAFFINASPPISQEELIDMAESVTCKQNEN